MEAFVKDYGSEEVFMKQEGMVLTRVETEEYFNEYIADLELEDYLTLNFT